MKDAFVIYANYAEQLELLSNNQCGILLRALMDYANGKDVPAMDTITYMAFLFIKANMEREEKETESAEDISRKRSEWGKLGGRPKKVQKGTFAEEKGAFPEKKVPFEAFEQKEVPLEEKERSKEKEYIPQEKDIPPYNPPTGDDGTDKAVEGYLAFMRSHSYIAEDLDNPSQLCGIDFDLLSRKIAESKRYLQGKSSLKWLISHYREIIADSYKDFERRGEPATWQGDLQLWQELSRAVQSAREETYCAETGCYYPLYGMKTPQAKEAMGKLYKGLSREIRAYFDPNSFLEICQMEEKDLKYERARFLKALPDIRKKLTEEGDGVA